MIRELPREITPTEERLAEASGESSSIRRRRGLSESQLGRRLQRRVREMHDELDQRDYYELLGLPREANADAIKDAYFELSIEFHPDRYFLIRSGELKKKIYAIYRRIGEAHAVLSDPDRRAEYDQGLDAGADKRAPEAQRSSVPASPPAEGFRIEAESKDPGAQQFIELARSAYDQEDRNGARMYLSFALAQDPGNTAIEGALSALVQRGAGLGPAADPAGQNRDCA
jgi:curved DNA-binding protein CbpA